MIDTLFSKALEHGPWGLLVALLLFAAYTLWGRYGGSQDMLLEKSLLWQKTLQDNTQAINGATDAQRAQTEVIRALADAHRNVAEEVKGLREDVKELRQTMASFRGKAS